MLANASPSDKLSKRLQVIFAQASISRRDMLGAMIGAGMNIATAKSESFAVNELKQQYINGYNNSSPNKLSTVPRDFEQMEVYYKGKKDKALTRKAQNALAFSKRYDEIMGNKTSLFEMEKEYQEHYFERLKKLVAEDEELKKLRKLQSKKAKIEQ